MIVVVVLILLFMFISYIYTEHYPCIVLKNKIDPLSYFNNVPKIIFRTHKSSLISRSMYEECHQKWAELNPEFSIVWYTNGDCDRFMERMGERVLKAYRKIKPGAFKADLWRACVLYRYGGVYVDSYCTPFVGVEEMLKNYCEGY